MSQRLRQLLPADAASSARKTKKSPTPPSASTSKRDEERACDTCRRRKVKCDGPEMSNRICTRCAAKNQPCTYTDEFKRIGPPKKGYVEGLEARLATVEGLLRKHRPDVDFMRELAPMQMAPLQDVSSMATSPDLDSVTIKAEPVEDWDEMLITRLTDQPRSVGIEKGFVGTSSPYPLIRALSQAREEVDGQRLHFFHRAEFWREPAHELRFAHLAEQQFDPDLPPRHTIDILVDKFFQQGNLSHPFFHRGLFQKSLDTEMHDSRFVAIVLLICACGSRYIDTDQESQYPAGWQYFEQVEPFLRVPTPQNPRLYDIQIYILSIMYLTSTTHSMTGTWVLIGMAFRMLTQVGAHRCQAYRDRPNLVDELWKRCFWSLISADRHLCASLGRPSGITDESFDISFPLEIDDEYWDLDNPDEDYPLVSSYAPTNPSKISALVYHSKLNLVLGVALRTLYSINSSRVRMGFVGPEWERQVLDKLDASLDDWLVSIPEHLRWNPRQPNPLWLSQSAILCSAYYHLQILIHNPFIQWSPSSSSESGPNFARSFATCTSAALACTDILAIQLRRKFSDPSSEVMMYPSQTPAALASAVVLLVNLYGRRAGLAGTQVHPSRIMAGVRASLDVIKAIESSWKSVGRAWDSLHELATGHSIPLPPSYFPEPSGNSVDNTGSVSALSPISSFSPLQFGPEEPIHQSVYNAFTDSFGALPDIPDFPGVNTTMPAAAALEYGLPLAEMQPGPSAIPQPSTTWWDLGNLPTDLQTLVSSTLTASGAAHTPIYGLQPQNDPSLGDFDGDSTFFGSH